MSTRDDCWLSITAFVTRPSNFGQSMRVTSSFSRFTKPHSEPTRKRRLLRCEKRPSTPSSGPVAASIFARKVPFLVKMLIFPCTSPATKYFVPCCEATVSAVSLGTSPSSFAGTCICFVNCAVTLTWEPRYWDTFSWEEFRRACFCSFVRRCCRTLTLCTRMMPEASAVVTKYSSCEGETARFVIGESWPEEKVQTSSPEGVKSRTAPFTCTATRSAEGMAVWAVEVGEEVRGFLNGRNLMKLTGSSCKITAFEIR
mmetsp:Transcript_92103/g.159898  ORF Transcript_92103/g.159898 Transcript_92103/m.159898 type:complete len:256 (+) Transcript_92103:736-1503(+)